MSESEHVGDSGYGKTCEKPDVGQMEGISELKMEELDAGRDDMLGRESVGMPKFPSVTQLQIDTLVSVSKVEDTKVGVKTTVLSLTLPCGFVIVESSSCVSPENYDHDVGKKLCLERIKEKLWMLEGYRLQWRTSKEV